MSTTAHPQPPSEIEHTDDTHHNTDNPSTVPEESLEELQQKLTSDGETQQRAAELVHNMQEVKARMQAAKAGAGLHRRGNDEGLFLIAVSKLKPASDVLALHTYGQNHFGENYIQELQKKSALLPQSIAWHYIGALQSSAVPKLAKIRNLHSVHSIDSSKKAVLLNKHRPDDYPPVHVYIQVNTSGEDSKSGISPLADAKDNGSGAVNAELLETVKIIREECPKLKLQGLMTIGAIARSVAAGEGEENEDFKSLVEIAEKVEKEAGLGKEGLSLSMGMSEDFEEAVRMGASCVRVGSVIFGERKKKGEVL